MLIIAFIVFQIIIVELAYLVGKKLMELVKQKISAKKIVKFVQTLIPASNVKIQIVILSLQDFVYLNVLFNIVMFVIP